MVCVIFKTDKLTGAEGAVKSIVLTLTLSLEEDTFPASSFAVIVKLYEVTADKPVTLKLVDTALPIIFVPL